MSIIKELEAALADACDQMATEAREALIASGATYPEATEPLVPRPKPS